MCGGGSVTEPKGGKRLHLKTSPHPRTICILFPLVLPPGLRPPGLSGPGGNRDALRDPQASFTPNSPGWGRASSGRC